jgi:hypothetical protein
MRLTSQFDDSLSTPRVNPRMVVRTMPQARHQQGVEQADDRGLKMRAARGVGNQSLVDVVAGRLGKKAEAEGLADGLQVRDGVADDVGDKGQQGRQGEDLDEDRAGVLVVPQPAEREALAGDR